MSFISESQRGQQQQQGEGGREKERKKKWWWWWKEREVVPLVLQRRRVHRHLCSLSVVLQLAADRERSEGERRKRGGRKHDGRSERQRVRGRLSAESERLRTGEREENN